MQKSNQWSLLKVEKVHVTLAKYGKYKYNTACLLLTYWTLYGDFWCTSVANTGPLLL